MPPAGAIIVIDDDSDDEEIAIVSRKFPQKPRDMDQASWDLIQQLESTDSNPINNQCGNKSKYDDNKLEELHSPFSRSVKRPLEHRRRDKEDAASLAVARKLHDREDRKLRRLKEQEQADMAVAQRLHEDETQKVNEAKKARAPPSKQQVLDALRPCQRHAVDYVQKRAEKMHKEALTLLQERLSKLNYKPEDLVKCLDYIRDDAPIVIHMKEATLALLANDTHYRNLFETSTSGGNKDQTTRRRWETDMFGSSYKAYCPPFDRPKYGALNITGDIAGVKSARAYGAIFMILHQHLRHRATFFDKDTGNFFDKNTGGFISSSNQTLATSEYYAHVLNGYSDDDLHAVMHVASTARIGGAASACSVYKEVQVHGPVCLATDIQGLSIPGKEKDASKALKDTVSKFQKMAKCNVFWQGDLLED